MGSRTSTLSVMFHSFILKERSQLIQHTVHFTSKTGVERLVSILLLELFGIFNRIRNVKNENEPIAMEVEGVEDKSINQLLLEACSFSLGWFPSLSSVSDMPERPGTFSLRVEKEDRPEALSSMVIIQPSLLRRFHRLLLESPFQVAGGLFSLGGTPSSSKKEMQVRGNVADGEQ